MVITLKPFELRFDCAPTQMALAICAFVLLTGVAIAQGAAPAAMSRGAYLAAAADCAGCHTAGPQKPPFAGGLAINSPFGTIYATNITPDPVAGIGQYSLQDFTRAVRAGIAKDGRRLYPAMPYASFSAMLDDDVKALYAYFMHEVVAVGVRPAQTKLPFPFNQRWGIWFWDALFADQKRFKPHDERDTAWNRGAYLVQSFGHCGACHTRRGIAYQEKAHSESSSLFLTGAVLDNWFAPDLTGDPASGLGRWSEADIIAFLKTGRGGQAAAFGSMISVIENSMQFMQDDDLHAIAHYLKSLSAQGEHATYRPGTPAVALASSAILTGRTERPGVGLYLSACAKCHKASGRGDQPKFPKLAGSSAVLSDNATSLIRLVLEGGKTAQTKWGGKSAEMPGFAKRFSDREIADILSFTRNSWGNNASPVTTRDVATLRGQLKK